MKRSDISLVVATCVIVALASGFLLHFALTEAWLSDEEKEERESHQFRPLNKTIRLLVEKQHASGKGSIIVRELFKPVEQVLEAAGFTVVGPQAKEFDAELTIWVEGARGGTDYVGSVPGQFRWANIGGELHLKSSDAEQSNRFSGFNSSWGRGFPPDLYLLKQSDFLSALCPMVSPCLGIEATRPALNAARSETPWIRSMAAEALGNLGYARCVAPLLSLLKDEHHDVRSSAARALGIIKDPKSVEPLIDALQDESSKVRASAVIALGNIKDARAVAPLIAALQSSSESIGEYAIREPAIVALAKIKDPRAVKALGEFLNSKVGWSLKQKAAWALAEIGDPAAIEPLMVAFRSYSSPFASEAAGKALISIGKPAVPSLIDALGDKNGRLRSRAAKTLGVIRDPQAIFPLIAALKDEHNTPREFAAEALSNIGEPAVKPLIAALDDENRNVREGAETALVKIGKPAAMPAIALLGNRSQSLRGRAIAARILGKIKDSKAVSPLILVLADENEHGVCRGFSADALVKIGGPAVSPLIALLKDTRSVSSVRLIAVHVLWRIGDARAIQPLTETADKDTDPKVRNLAQRALEKIREANAK